MTTAAEKLRREAARAKREELVGTMAMQIRVARLVEPVREFRFHDSRKWRFDFAWPDYCVAVEVDGGTYTQGRHTRGKGYAEDCRKLDEAAVLGWRVLRFPVDMIRSGEAIRLLERIIPCQKRI